MVCNVLETNTLFTLLYYIARTIVNFILITVFAVVMLLDFRTFWEIFRVNVNNLDSLIESL